MRGYLKTLRSSRNSIGFQRRAFQWAQQPMIEFFSRHGLIPTYSFPVHSIRLEILTSNSGFLPSRGSVRSILIRDARLGIAEIVHRERRGRGK